MNTLALDRILRQALIEDIGQGDITSEAIFTTADQAKGCLIAKQELILAGTEVVTRLFALLDTQVKVRFFQSDGDRIEKGCKFASLQGPTRSLLAGERVALNFLQRLSGIATATNRYVSACGQSRTIIVDTRKTTPGLRMLEKYAVTAGGGRNHRYGLDSLVLIKDNHIKAAGGIAAAVTRVRTRIAPLIKIEVEVESIEQAAEALSAGVDVIMLDNMSLTAVEAAVRLINRRALVEVSGNITEEKIAALAAIGVDIISSGALTHSAAAADISLRLE
ncbi:MAG: carboxylating nicotinate-nucleotide diphosphorylase [Sporomusaceae bacterium]|nr:carboxylating nicotinate-nucleotide diphosphorylase [Sporomusaceae bacterium]